MRFTVALSLCACMCWGAMFVSASPASAFGFAGFGGKLGYMTPEGLDGTLTGGAHLEFQKYDSRLHLIPSLMYWSSNDVSDLSANADLYYHFAGDGMITPYVGGGLGVNFFSNDGSNQSDTKLGANLFGGLRMPGSGSHYFLEGRYTASDISQFAVLGGITFHGWSSR